MNEDLTWMHLYACESGMSSDEALNLHTEIETSLDEAYPDRDLFFKGGLGHAHTTLYTGRFAPNFFADLNRRGVRRSGRLGLQRVGEISHGGWSRYIVSSGEVPELLVRLEGAILLLFTAGVVPIPSGALVDLVEHLSGGNYHHDEAEELMHLLYEMGLFLDSVSDRRATELCL